MDSALKAISGMGVPRWKMNQKIYVFEGTHPVNTISRDIVLG